jgi:hypothetical protein
MPRERDDDAPRLPIEAPRPVVQVHDDAPPLTDETDEARIARLSRHHADATRHLCEALRLLAAGKHPGFALSLHAFDKSTTEAAALARVLSKSFTARR